MPAFHGIKRLKKEDKLKYLNMLKGNTNLIAGAFGIWGPPKRRVEKGLKSLGATPVMATKGRKKGIKNSDGRGGTKAAIYTKLTAPRYPAKNLTDSKNRKCGKTACSETPPEGASEKGEKKNTTNSDALLQIVKTTSREWE